MTDVDTQPTNRPTDPNNGRLVRGFCSECMEESHVLWEQWKLGTTQHDCGTTLGTMGWVNDD